MDNDLQVALDQALVAVSILRNAPISYENVSAAKEDLEAAVATLEQWLEDHVMDESAVYHPDCPKCLRGLVHTQQEHDEEIDRVRAASRACDGVVDEVEVPGSLSNQPVTAGWGGRSER